MGSGWNFGVILFTLSDEWSLSTQITRGGGW